MKYDKITDEQRAQVANNMLVQMEADHWARTLELGRVKATKNEEAIKQVEEAIKEIEQQITFVKTQMEGLPDPQPMGPPMPGMAPR